MLVIGATERALDIPPVAFEDATSIGAYAGDPEATFGSAATRLRDST